MGRGNTVFQRSSLLWFTALRATLEEDCSVVLQRLALFRSTIEAPRCYLIKAVNNNTEGGKKEFHCFS